MKKLVILLTLCVIPLTQFAQKASDYFQAAEQGDAEAQFSLGYCYENGLGVTKSIVNAKKWYKKAAAQGDDNAKEALKKLK